MEKLYAAYIDKNNAIPVKEFTDFDECQNFTWLNNAEIREGKKTGKVLIPVFMQDAELMNLPHELPE